MKVQYLPVILLPLSQVAAWTQSPHFACRVVHTVLRLHEDDQVDMERNRLEHLFFDATADFQEDFIPVVNNMDQMSHLPVHDWMESSHDNMFDDWSDTSPCFGDECDVSHSFQCVSLHACLDKNMIL